MRLAPEPMKKFAQGLWDHQIANQTTGEFSRHASYTSHGPKVGSEYPRHGAFYISLWTNVYRATRDAVLLKPIESLLNAYLKDRDPKTLCLHMTYGEAILGVQTATSMSIDLHDVIPQLPPALAAKAKDLVDGIDTVFLKLPHELKPGGKGFVDDVVPATLKPARWSRSWEAAYGGYTHSWYANQSIERYRQTGNEKYKKLFLDAAGMYMTWTPVGLKDLYPQVPGEVIKLMLAAYRVTGEQKYLLKAREVADKSIPIFFNKGPLPRVSSSANHYESQTRCDTFALILAELYAEIMAPGRNFDTRWADR